MRYCLYRHWCRRLFSRERWRYCPSLSSRQGALAILNAAGFTPATPFSPARTWPLAVPQIWSWAFWGGVWGLAYGFFERWFPEKFFAYWLAAILFGAMFPTLVLWFVVFPLKGRPIAAGWDQARCHSPHYPWGVGIENGAAAAISTIGVSWGRQDRRLSAAHVMKAKICPFQRS
jgi:hypothetical protein